MLPFILIEYFINYGIHVFNASFLLIYISDD